MRNQLITPFLWFDGKAEEAAHFYTSFIKNSKVESINPTVSVFNLNGLQFNALNGGNIFQFTNAISLFIKTNDSNEIDNIWNQLKKNGTILMDLDEYPWCKKYGWITDKYGLSWQLFLDEAPLQILPTLLFVDKQFGNAQKAIDLYCSLFKDSKTVSIVKFDEENEDLKDKIQYAEFILANQKFVAMESPLKHNFGFNEAFSFVIHCEDQDEVDYYWDSFINLGGEENQCGWLKDKFGVSWQVVPKLLVQLLNDTDREKADRVMNAMMKMKKIDCAKLQDVYNNK